MTPEPRSGFPVAPTAVHTRDSERRVDQPNHCEESNPAGGGHDPGDEQEEADEEGPRVAHGPSMRRAALGFTAVGCASVPTTPRVSSNFIEAPSNVSGCIRRGGRPFFCGSRCWRSSRPSSSVLDGCGASRTVGNKAVRLRQFRNDP